MPIILFVFKDQTDTTSLNPTRLLTASQLAQEEMQRRIQSNLLQGHLPQMIYLTYTGPEEQGALLAREFIDENPRVIALIGDINSQGTRLLAQVAEEKELVHLSFFATDESIFTDHPWSFSYRERISNEIDILFKLIFDYLNHSNPVLVVNDLQNLTPRWEGLSDQIFQRTLQSPPIIMSERSQSDFDQPLDQLQQQFGEADSVVLLLSTQQNQHFLQQAAIRKIDVPIIISGISLDPDHFLEFSSLDLQMYSFTFRYFLDLYQSTNPTLEQFAQRYQIAMGLRRIDSLGPWIYDGVLSLLESITIDSTAQTLREHLNSLDGSRLVGPVSFTQDGILSRNTFVPIRLENGRIYELQP